MIGKHEIDKRFARSQSEYDKYLVYIENSVHRGIKKFKLLGCELAKIL